jgi:predicted RNase H-like nuclease (RuvC/YqgF family)
LKQKELKQLDKDLKAKMKLLKKTEASLEKLGKNGELAALVDDLKEENEKLKAELEANIGNNASSEELEKAQKVLFHILYHH